MATQVYGIQLRTVEATQEQVIFTFHQSDPDCRSVEFDDVIVSINQVEYYASVVKVVNHQDFNEITFTVKKPLVSSDVIDWMITGDTIIKKDDYTHVLYFYLEGSAPNVN